MSAETVFKAYLNNDNNKEYKHPNPFPVAVSTSSLPKRKETVFVTRAPVLARKPVNYKYKRIVIIRTACKS